jgi:hypothetical protein
MDEIERMCREAEIVLSGQPYSGSTEHRCTQAMLAMLVHLTQQAERGRDRLTIGDYFTHERTGARFVCRAVTRHDYGGAVPIVRAEIEPQA